MSNDFQKALEGYCLTTAEIVYHLPDFPSILQSYIWQEYDFHPHFPKLHRFCCFWQEKMDGKIFHVRIANSRLLTANEIKLTQKSYHIN